VREFMVRPCHWSNESRCFTAFSMTDLKADVHFLYLG
jgi:hypothetical protein